MEPVARVLRSSTTHFSAGTRLNQLTEPAFGALVKSVGHFNPAEVTYGVITDIRIADDPLVRQMILADSLNEEMLLDQRLHRMAPIELEVLALGYLHANRHIIQAVPPRPPMGLDPVYLCDAEELVIFGSELTYIQLILENGEDLHTEQLLAAIIKLITAHLPDKDRYPYLVKAGREITRLLGGDVRRIENVLGLLKTGWGS